MGDRDVWPLILVGILFASALVVSLDWLQFFSLFDWLNSFFNSVDTTFWVLMFGATAFLFLGLLSVQLGSRNGFAILLIVATTLIIYNLYAVFI